MLIPLTDNRVHLPAIGRSASLRTNILRFLLKCVQLHCHLEMELFNINKIGSSYVCMFLASVFHSLKGTLKYVFIEFL